MIAALREQIAMLTEDSEKLAAQTSQLRLILSSNQARGRWGEETLRRVVEAAGMSPHCDFLEQAAGDDGRPDLVVQLPHDKKIIVDAKVPDLAFLEKAGTETREARAKALEQHAATVRETIRRLASRDYPRQFAGSLDHVILFFPAESLFSAAVEGDPELITWAATKRILLATPASFIGLLRAVALSWRQYDQDRNAKYIAETARELYKRITTMLGHMEDVRAGLDKAVKGFNQMTRSYETRVRPQGERLLEYGVDPGNTDEPPHVEELNLALEDISQRNLL
jgi:DNA recombination protein RmuC